MKYTLSVLVENQPGVLSKVISLFSRRGYNIDSLAVGTSGDPSTSRITIVGEGDNYTLEQVEKQLNKLVPVIKVRELGESDSSVSCELILVKLMGDEQKLIKMQKIADDFGAKIEQSTEEAMIIRFVGAAEDCDKLLEKLKPLGDIEVARSGQLALDINEL